MIEGQLAPSEEFRDSEYESQMKEIENGAGKQYMTEPQRRVLNASNTAPDHLNSNMSISENDAMLGQNKSLQQNPNGKGNSKGGPLINFLDETNDVIDQEPKSHPVEEVIMRLVHNFIKQDHSGYETARKELYNILYGKLDKELTSHFDHELANVAA